jgi:hypothetical protein
MMSKLVVKGNIFSSWEKNDSLVSENQFCFLAKAPEWVVQDCGGGEKKETRADSEKDGREEEIKEVREAVFSHRTYCGKY